MDCRPGGTVESLGGRVIRPDIILRMRRNRWEHLGSEPNTRESASLRAEYRALIAEAGSALALDLTEIAARAAARRDRILYNFACEAYVAKRAA